MFECVLRVVGRTSRPSMGKNAWHAAIIILFSISFVVGFFGAFSRQQLLR